MSASVIASTVYGSSLTAAASSSPSSSAQRSSTSSSPFSGKEAPKPTAATTTTDMRSSSNGSGSSSNSNSKELKDIILTGNAVASLDANVIRTKERNIGLVSSSKRSDGNRRSSSSSGRDYCLFGETDTGKGCNRCPNCPGFASHEWRQSCVACKCPRSAHALTPGNSVFGYERLAGLDAMPNAQQQQQQTPTHGNIKNSRRDLIPAAAHPMINMVIEGYAWSPPVSHQCLIEHSAILKPQNPEVENRI